MPTIAAPQRQRAISQNSKPNNRSAANRHNLRHPPKIGIAHGDWLATMPAPLISLQVSKVRVPTNINPRQRIARASKERLHLRFITLKQHDLNRQPRLFMKIAAHAFPYRHYLRIIRNGAEPNRLAAFAILFSVRHSSSTSSPKVSAQNSGNPNTA